jgi:hypothetical protein
MASHSDDDAEDLLAAWHAHKEAEKLYEAGASPSPGTSVLDMPLPATIDFRDG